MMNMSYCRFQNTLAALRECLEAMADNQELSKDEEEAKKNLIKECTHIAYDFGDIEDDDEDV